jgi:UDP-N-acetyl-2-amino-2-deoxyglucuronate dehydrogenase
MDKLRCGVIGLNGIGGRHAQALAAMDRVELVAVADLRDDLRDPMAEKFGAMEFSDYQEMVKMCDLDAVVIGTPHFLHAPMSLFCLEAGLHVFVEKPVAMTVSEADQVIDLAKTKGLKLAVGHNYRTFPGNRAMKKLIDEGALGDIHRVLWQWLETRPETYYERDRWRCTWAQAGGGVLMNQVSHDIDLICWLLGEPVAVSAMIENWGHKAEIEDAAIANIQFKSGALCNVQFSICDRRLNYRQVSGDKGTLEYRDEKNANSHVPDTFVLGRYNQPMRSFILGHDGVAAQNTIAWEDVPVEDAHDANALLNSFVSAVLDGGEPITTGESARWALEVINGMIWSGIRQEVVKLPVNRDVYDALMRELTGGETEVMRVR